MNQTKKDEKKKHNDKKRRAIKSGNGHKNP